MSNVINMDLLSRSGKATIRRGAVAVADVPDGYNNFVCYNGEIVIIGADVPPMILNTETNQFEKLVVEAAWDYSDQKLIVIASDDAS